MERNTADRGLSAAVYPVGDYDYWVATRRDEPVLRELLARIATGGDVRLSMRREPDAFAADYGALSQGYVLARERRSGEFVGLCERVVREAFVNGEVCAVPYLAGLRVAPGFRHRLHVLRGGFEAVRRLLVAPGEPTWALTSIMSDNAEARRLLGANLAGMPRYEPVGELSTFALLPGGSERLERANEPDLPAIATLLRRRATRTQFAAHWNLETLEAFARHEWLRPRDYLLARGADGAVRACAALWDQSAHRQLVVAGYSPRLRRTRPFINLAARLTGRPALPAVGQPLRAGWLSLVAVEDDAPGDLARLLGAARAEARKRGLHVLFAAWPSAHAHAEVARELARGREYRSQLYRVRWAEEPAPELDTRLPVAPEPAFL